jgi:hypothetical protein
MIKDYFKRALADILFGEEIDKIVHGARRRDRKKLRAYEQTIKEACRMDRRNLQGMSMVPLIELNPTTELWASVMYKAIAEEARDRVLRDGEDVP